MQNGFGTGVVERGRGRGLQPLSNRLQRDLVPLKIPPAVFKD